MTTRTKSASFIATLAVLLAAACHASPNTAATENKGLHTWNKITRDAASANGDLRAAFPSAAGYVEIHLAWQRPANSDANHPDWVFFRNVRKLFRGEALGAQERAAAIAGLKGLKKQFDQPLADIVTARVEALNPSPGWAPWKFHAYRDTSTDLGSSLVIEIRAVFPVVYAGQTNPEADFQLIDRFIQRETINPGELAAAYRILRAIRGEQFNSDTAVLAILEVP